MLSLTRNAVLRSKRFSSQLALALALTSGAVLGITALEAPAFAQKKGKANYSKGFIEAYSPIEAMSKAQPADIAAITAATPTMIAAIETPDDKLVAGNLLYSIGSQSKNSALQRQGVDMMLESGKVPAADLPKYIFLAGQLAYQDKDWATARTRFLSAMEAGYSGADPEAVVAETYFSENNYAGGLKYLTDAINGRISAGKTIDQNWLKRGISVAYNNNLAEAAATFAGLNAKLYPGRDSWGDAIAIQRNFGNYENQETLDLLRLSDRTGSLRSERDYVDYIEAADARRLPGEVTRVVDAGIAAGQLDAQDLFVAESRTVAKGRLSTDQAELPALESDARKPGATAVTAAAAGDALLSYGKAAQAEEMYKIALGKPGADTARVLTRLGIAQVDQGKIDEAKANFAKVTGNRAPIAKLWMIYADQKGGAPAAAATAEAQ